MIPLLLLATFIVLATGATPYKVYVIHTGSMNPTIPSGSAVIVHEGHYRIGQVVTFREDGLTVTHRLLSINAQGLTTTKGDANASPDPWHVPKSQIVGGVVAAPRYVGYWITYFKSPLGLASLVLVIAVLWQLWAITDRSSVDVVSEESRSAREKSRPKRRQGAEVPSGLVTATATMSPEPWVMQASGHAEASITEIMNTEVIEEGATLGRDQTEGAPISTNDESTSVPMTEASDVLVITEATPHQLGDDHDQSETTVASEDDVALDVETRERFDPAVDLDTAITALGDDASSDISAMASTNEEEISAAPVDFSSDIVDAAATNDEGIDPTPTELSQPSPLEDEEMRRARMAKWFGVVRTGPDRGFSGSRSR